MATSAGAESFNAKPGAWELNFTTLTTGMLIPPDVLAKMPPEQRAKIEQSMQARSGKPRTHASKTCVTQEDLDQNRIIKKEEEKEDESGGPISLDRMFHFLSGASRYSTYAAVRRVGRLSKYTSSGV